MVGKNDMKFKFQGQQIKFYWNTATLTCLPIICGYFPDTASDLKSCNRLGHKAENIYLIL